MFEPEPFAEVVAAGLAEGHSPSQIGQHIADLLNDQDWVRAHGHPTRRAILRFLRERGTASPSRTSRYLNADVGVISYHYRGLERLGLIELIEKVPRRGAVEHIYRLCDTPRRPAETIKPPKPPPRPLRPAVAHPDNYVSIARAATQAGVTSQTVYNWVRSGRLASAHVNGRLSVLQRELTQLIRER